MSKLLFSLFAATVLVAQTRIDIKTQAQGAVLVEQTDERSEDEWCPSPTFTRTSDKVLTILPTVNVNAKCYLHFSALPVNIKEYSAPATVTVLGERTDLLFVYWKLVNNEPKLFVSAKITEQLTCTDCTLELRTEEAFPKGSIIVGLYGILVGRFALSGHPLISSHQIAMADATAMLIEYSPDAGYIFRLQAPVITPAAAQQAAQLKEAQVNLEVANTNSLVRAMETASAPGNAVLDMQGRVANLEQALARVESQIPAKDSDVTALRSNIERAKQELDQYKGNLNQTMRQFADNQVEQITMQYQTLQRQVADSVSTRMVNPPTKPNSACEVGHYAQDAKYKYECLRGLWYRFVIDSSWK